MEIIDAHHHLWRYNHCEYGWMDDSMEVLKQDFLPGDLLPALKNAGVTGTIVVQARQTTGETEWLLQLADENPFIIGVVGWVDLRSDEIDKQLSDFSRHPKLVGVRHVIHDEPDPGFMLGEAFIRGIAALEKFDLAYDLLLFPEHLPNAFRLAKQFPGQRFVIDHLAKPFIKDKKLSPWREDLLRIGELPNVYCKVSGMVTEADHGNWKYENFIPYLDATVAAFGTERIMVGSDWPVCLLAAEYSDVMGIPARYFGSFGLEEQRKIFSLNCRDFYKTGN